MLREYVRYLKDNPEGYWFKRKLYGWGWTPAKWQGWVAVLALVAVVMTAARTLLVQGKTTEYGVVLALAVAAIIVLGYWKGEKPRWQWGVPKKEGE